MDVRMLVLSAVAATLTAPVGASVDSCTSHLPVLDKRAASFTCTGLHPGALLSVPYLGGGVRGCTAGYAFADSSGQRYLTVPGSCHLDHRCLEDVVVEELPPPLPELLPDLPTCLFPEETELEPYHRRGGPVVRDGDGRRIGTLVYAVTQDGIDIALVRVDAGVPLSPAVPLYGGPRRTGAASGVAEEAYAYSATHRPGTVNARTGVLYSLSGIPRHHADGLLAVPPGTPVMKPDGTAVGIYKGWYEVGLGYPVQPLGPALERIARRTKLSLRLLTAPLT